MLKFNVSRVLSIPFTWKTTGVLMAWTMCAWAGLKPLGEPYTVVKDLKGHQQNLSMVAGRKIGFVAWQNNVGGGPGDRVMLQILGPGYAGIGEIKLVGPATQNDPEENPGLTMMTDGGGVIVWEDGPRYDKDVFLRFIDKTGNFVTGPAIANTFRDGPQRAPAVAELVNGDVVVVWMSKGQDGSGEGVFGQRFTRLGVKVGSEFMVSQSTERDQIWPAILTLPRAGFVVAWVTEVVKGVTSDGAPNLRGNVMARFFDNEGRPTGNEYQLNGTDALCAKPFLAAHPEGGFVAAWAQQDEILKFNLTDIYVRRFSAAGLPEGVETRHNVNVAGRQGAPKVAFAGGKGLVVWETGARNGSGYEVHARLLDGGAEFRVNTRTEFLQRKPVLFTTDGSFVVCWLDVISAGKSILTAQQYQMSDGASDITAGEHVNTMPSGSRTVVLTATHSVKNLDKSGEDLRRQAAKILAQNQEIKNREVSEAALISRQAAARKAEMKLSSRAKQTLLHPITYPSIQEQRNVSRTAFSQNAAKAAATEGEHFHQEEALPSVVRTSPVAIKSQRSNLPQYRANQGRTILSSSRTSRMNTLRRTQAANFAKMSMNRRAQRSSSAVRLSTQAKRTLATPSLEKRSQISRTANTPWAAYNPRANTGTLNARSGRMNMRQSTNRGSRYSPSSVRTSKQVTANSTAQRLAKMRQNSMTRSHQTQSISVTPVDARLNSRGNNMSLEWNTRMGRSYRVEKSSDGRNWEAVGAPRRGTGRIDSIPILPGNKESSYRVVPRK